MSVKESLDYIRITTVERCLFDIEDLNENMKSYSFKVGKMLYLVNTKLKKAYKLINMDGYLLFNDDCFDYSKIENKCIEEEVEKDIDIHSKKVDYGFYCVYNYKDGMSLWKWLFYPDGVYLADEDGFGVKPNNEIDFYGIISSEGKVVVPFQPVSSSYEGIFALLMGSFHDNG